MVWELNKSRTLIGVALPHKSRDLGHALERLRKNFYHLWQVLEEAALSATARLPAGRTAEGVEARAEAVAGVEEGPVL